VYVYIYIYFTKITKNVHGVFGSTWTSRTQYRGTHDCNSLFIVPLIRFGKYCTRTLRYAIEINDTRREIDKFELRLKRKRCTYSARNGFRGTRIRKERVRSESWTPTKYTRARQSRAVITRPYRWAFFLTKSAIRPLSGKLENFRRWAAVACRFTKN